MLVAEETAGIWYFSPPEEISSRLDMTFSCKQNRSSKRCLFAILLILTWVWKKGPNRIREHWFWRLRYLLHTSKCTFMSWLLGSLGLPSRRKDTHQLMSRVDYGFNQCSVVSFVIKKLYVYLFMVKQCTYLFILMYFMQIYFHLLWSENKFTDFVVFLNFLLTLHAPWII